MKMKCIGGLANGEIIDVPHGSSREHDQIQVPAKITFEVKSFPMDVTEITNLAHTSTPYYYYKVCCFRWQDEYKHEQKLFFLCPIKWSQFEALAYVIGA